MIIYHMIRHEDVSGNSGTGHIATLYDIGGPCILVWDKPKVIHVQSIAVYRSKSDATMIHGHNGKTVFTLAWITPTQWWEVACKHMLRKLFNILL